ncbi:MAG: hypothetical protein IJB74_10325 [Clostridia bacterium]|nr:hypothetical protein [Clostridia bacterium]
MKACTFFGETDAATDIRYDLKQVLIDLIENEGVSLFYVGDEGNFDKMVRTELKLFSTVYEHIRFSVLICNIPYTELTEEDFWHENICPFGGFFGEKSITPDRVNKYMINCSDYVVTYVTNSEGSAYKYKALAVNKGKKIIELYDNQTK